MPPCASKSWNRLHARLQSSSVRASKLPAPAAGSATFASFASCIKMSCALRAMRRAKSSGRPSARVKGKTVIASALPTPAQNTPIAVRKIFTNGSYFVIIRKAVSAWTRIGFGVKPQANSTHAQRSRKARNFARDKNSSASAARRNAISLRASSSERPSASSSRRYSTPVATTHPSSWASPAPAS